MASRCGRAELIGTTNDRMGRYQSRIRRAAIYTWNGSIPAVGVYTFAAKRKQARLETERIPVKGKSRRESVNG